MGPVRQNPIQRTVRSVHMCALHCAQLLHTILHRTDLIIFPLAFQTITIAPIHHRPLLSTYTSPVSVFKQSTYFSKVIFDPATSPKIKPLGRTAAGILQSRNHSRHTTNSVKILKTTTKQRPPFQYNPEEACHQKG